LDDSAIIPLELAMGRGWITDPTEVHTEGTEISPPGTQRKPAIFSVFSAARQFNEGENGVGGVVASMLSRE
jgi:hypothetical protein